MDLDTTGWTDKASKNPDERRLYEESSDYISAYSAHTDLRIQRDGPALAIGGQWEEHGLLQLAFLCRRGLTPNSTLLDIGCGTGRFARRAVSFLNPGNYVGLDISRRAIEHCRLLAAREGWAEKNPTFVAGDGSLGCVPHAGFDIVWAHSVFTHLPPEIICGVLGDLARIQFGEFCFTYKRRDRPRRTGLKQFGYPPEWFVDQAPRVGLKCEPLPDRWPQGQSTMRVWQ